jgi:hypothetical protein
MFRTDLLSIIRSLNTVYTAIGICHASSVDCLLARSGWTVVMIISVFWNNRARSWSGNCGGTSVTLQQTFVIVTAVLTQGSLILREEASVLRRIDRFRCFRIKKATLCCPLTFLWTLDAARSSASWCP